MNQLVTTQALVNATPSTIEGDTTPQDWQQLVTPGHVIQARITHRPGKYLALATLAGLASIFVAFAGPGFLSLPIPGVVYDALRSDPDTYTDLGGGNRTSYKLLWLGSVPILQGRDPVSFRAMVAAVQSDLKTYGLDPHAWTETAKLSAPPKITRPRKAFNDENKLQISSGVVTIPGEDDEVSTVDIFGRTDGLLNVVTLSPYGDCVSYGIEVPDCTKGDFADPSFAYHLSLFEPVKPQQEAK